MDNDRNIYCFKCQEYVGTIRDAKLQKNLLFLCIKCYKKKHRKADIPPGFENIFGKFI